MKMAKMRNYRSQREKMKDKEREVKLAVAMIINKPMEQNNATVY